MPEELTIAGESVEPPEVRAERPAGPRIVSSARPPARADAVGSSRRDYPLLRGAVVKLAHDDPATAARLLAALLPVQAAVLTEPVAYDLTIRGAGTFAVTVTESRAFVETRERPRPRAESDFHLTADPLALAELLAGVEHRIGRFFGPVRARGSHRRVNLLRELPQSRIGLAEAARAGARLDPELVYRAFAYAVHPSWTRGHRFTIEQAITGGDRPQTWYLTARNGAGLTASAARPETTPDASVTMTRATFDRMLREEPVPRGERPVVRGDREVVALMRTWIERARGAGA